MKIAVTSQGDTIDSVVDPRFGRAKQFILLDTDTGEWMSVDNKLNLNAAQGAGIQAAQAVSELQVDAVLTGHCGPKAFRVLREAGIKIYTGAKGSVEMAAARVAAGDCEEAASPDVEGHW